VLLYREADTTFSHSPFTLTAFIVIICASTNINESDTLNHCASTLFSDLLLTFQENKQNVSYALFLLNLTFMDP